MLLQLPAGILGETLRDGIARMASTRKYGWDTSLPWRMGEERLRIGSAEPWLPALLGGTE